MTTNIPEGAQRSPDGHYWWDGSQWQLVDQSGSAASSGTTTSGVGSADASAQDAASYLSLADAGADVMTGLPASALSAFGAGELQSLTSLLHDLEAAKQHLADMVRHGCWCGPGNVCEEEKDALDACCHQHDLAYDSLGVASGSSMWTREGLKLTVEADEALVNCSSGVSGLDSDGENYRTGVQLVFGKRAQIGRLLRRLPF
jgi:hypothetical protein